VDSRVEWGDISIVWEQEVVRMAKGKTKPFAPAGDPKPKSKAELDRQQGWRGSAKERRAAQLASCLPLGGGRLRHRARHRLPGV
jgi:hypothetical protein